MVSVFVGFWLSSRPLRVAHEISQTSFPDEKARILICVLFVVLTPFHAWFLYLMSANFVDLLLRMEDHDIIPSCLSAERHKPRDFLLHYMGCEQFFQREEYLASLNAEQIKQIETKLERIEYLRAALSNDIEEGRQLVQHLKSSLKRWRDTKDYQDGINRVQELRTTYFALNGTAQKEVQTPMRVGEYDPDVDTNAYLIRFKNGRPVRDIVDSRFHEQYPCYRISMHDLIYGKEDQSPLISPRGTINYFHFPANNMLVSRLIMHATKQWEKEAVDNRSSQWAEVRTPAFEVIGGYMCGIVVNIHALTVARHHQILEEQACPFPGKWQRRRQPAHGCSA